MNNEALIVLILVLASAMLGVHIGKLPRWVQNLVIVVVMIAAILVLRERGA